MDLKEKIMKINCDFIFSNFYDSINYQYVNKCNIIDFTKGCQWTQVFRTDDTNINFDIEIIIRNKKEERMPLVKKIVDFSPEVEQSYYFISTLFFGAEREIIEKMYHHKIGTPNPCIDHNMYEFIIDCKDNYSRKKTILNLYLNFIYNSDIKFIKKNKDSVINAFNLILATKNNHIFSKLMKLFVDNEYSIDIRNENDYNFTMNILKYCGFLLDRKLIRKINRRNCDEISKYTKLFCEKLIYYFTVENKANDLVSKSTVYFIPILLENIHILDDNKSVKSISISSLITSISNKIYHYTNEESVDDIKKKIDSLYLSQ